MYAKEPTVLVVSPDPESVLSKPLRLDEEDLADARKDQRWAQFARDSEAYARRTTWRSLGEK
jgi:hypothetical protein